MLAERMAIPSYILKNLVEKLEQNTSMMEREYRFTERETHFTCFQEDLRT